MKKILFALLLFTSVCFGQGKIAIDPASGLSATTQRYVTAAGTNTYTVTYNYAVQPGYFGYLDITVKFTNGNTGASTINVNGLGAKAIKKNVSSALVSGDILAGGLYRLIYDGTNFQLITPTGNLGIGTVTSVSASSPLSSSGGATPTITITSPLSIVNGGTNTTNLTGGSALFYDGTRVQENNSKFYWDNTNNRLCIGYNASHHPLNIQNGANESFEFDPVNGSVGGLMQLFNRAGSVFVGMDYKFLSHHFFISSSGEVATILNSGFFGLNQTTPTARFHVKDGHWKSEQTTAPTVSVTVQNGITAASLDANATDTKGIIATTGTQNNAGFTQIHVTFNVAYNIAPVVVVSHADNPNAVFVIYIVSGTTGFDVYLKSATPNANLHFNYIVIE